MQLFNLLLLLLSSSKGTASYIYIYIYIRVLNNCTASPIDGGYITLTKIKSAINILSELNPVHTIGVVFRLSIIFTYL
jgi:hypothetical protein